MKRLVNLSIILAAMMLSVAACDDSNDPTKTDGATKEFIVSPTDAGVLNYDGDTVSVYTNTDVITIDSLCVFRYYGDEQPPEPVQSYNLNRNLCSGDKIKTDILQTDFLIIQFKDSVLDLISFAPEQIDMNLYQFKLYVSLFGKSQKVIEGLKDPYPLGWKQYPLTVEPSGISFGVEGGEIECEFKNYIMPVFVIYSIQVGDKIMAPENGKIDNKFEWLTIRSKAGNSSKFYIKAEPNETRAYREFIILCGDKINHEKCIITGGQSGF